MKLSLNNYVPVLKSKVGEKKALQHVMPNLKNFIIPILEIPEFKEVKKKNGEKKTINEHINTAFNNLASSLAYYRMCYIDCRELESIGSIVPDMVFKRAQKENIDFIPVTGIHRGFDTKAAIEYNKNGIAIRLTRSELESNNMTSEIKDFIKANNIIKESTDLILNLGPVEDMVATGITNLTNAFLDEIPKLTVWRNVIVSSCSFPISMKIVDRNSNIFVDRNEWMSWRNDFYAKRDSIVRVPVYSDCAIQHPIGVEGFDPRYMHASATIRYTTDNKWLLIKGSSTKLTPAKNQFPKLAKRLVYGHLNTYFKGTSHCQGCKDIKESADGIKGLGSPGVWRRIGTVHHISTIVKELQSLLFP